MEEGRKKAGRGKRRLVTVLAAVLALGAVYFLLHRYTQLPLYLYGSTFVKQQFCTQEGKIQFKNGRNWEDFTVRGISLEIPSALETDYDFYRKWIEQIGELHANTIRVTKRMEPDFYKALAAYNDGNPRPLYLLQGIEIEKALFQNAMDAQEAGLEKQLKRAARDTVDAVHGNLGREGYCCSVSDYVLGFVVGQSWDPDLILYTNRSEEDGGVYQGRYIRTSEYATAFENILAKTINTIFAYDTGKYRSQHLVAFGNEQNTDNLVHYRQKLNSLDQNRARLDENILYPRGEVKTGVFAAYQVNTGVAEEFNYEPYYRDYVTGKGEASPFRRYLMDLSESHQTMPVLITGVGLSTSRGSSGKDQINGYDRGGLTEEKQAEGLTVLYQDILAAKLSGCCITELFDNPDKTAWNTADMADEEGIGKWLNVQDSEQGLGLIRLTGAREKEITVDGQLRDWEEEQPFLEEKENRYYLVYDEKYLYLAGRIGRFQKNQDQVCIAFDSNPESGSREEAGQKLKFDREMDFLLRMEGSRGAELTVQEYYNAAAMEPELAETDAARWRLPERSSTVFTGLQQFVQKKTYLQNDPNITVEEVAKRLQETGSPYENTGDVVENCGVFEGEGPDYACSEEGFEIRLPWQLLNFSDPSGMRIFGDFYDFSSGKQRERIPVEEMYIQTFVRRTGITESFASVKIPLKGWETAAFGFEPKAAYTAVQELWE